MGQLKSKPLQRLIITLKILTISATIVAGLKVSFISTNINYMLSFIGLYDYTFIRIKPPDQLVSNIYYGCSETSEKLNWHPYDYEFNNSISTQSIMRGFVIRTFEGSKQSPLTGRQELLKNLFCSDTDYKKYLESKCHGSKFYGMQNYNYQGQLQYEINISCQ